MGKSISSKSASIPGPRIQDHRVTDDVAMVFILTM